MSMEVCPDVVATVGRNGLKASVKGPLAAGVMTSVAFASVALDDAAFDVFEVQAASKPPPSESAQKMLTTFFISRTFTVTPFRWVS
jgi:hypothetical protein